MENNKPFDCVEMQHQGAERVQARLAGMTLEEQLSFWEQRGRELIARQQEIIARKGRIQGRGSIL